MTSKDIFSHIVDLDSTILVARNKPGIELSDEARIKIEDEQRFLYYASRQFRSHTDRGNTEVALTFLSLCRKRIIILTAMCLTNNLEFNVSLCVHVLGYIEEYALSRKIILAAQPS